MHIIAGLFKNRIITTPKGLATRPTSSRLREALFNICQHSIEGARFLDLFAGSGAMGLEALSRGASSALFIDNSRESVRSIRQNLETLGIVDHAEVFLGDVFQHMKKLAEAKQVFDIIYADPPYEAVKRKGEGEQLAYSSLVIKFVDETDLLSLNGSLFIEDSTATHLAQENLKTLKLKSVRRMGRSALYHYYKN